MSKKMLWTLIVLMTLVLSGLILIQTNLIKSASEIREEQFDQMVKGALKRVVDQLELHEERVARESARAGKLPGESNAPGNINIFPRQEIGRFPEVSDFIFLKAKFSEIFMRSIRLFSPIQSLPGKELPTGLTKQHHLINCTNST